MTLNLANRHIASPQARRELAAKAVAQTGRHRDGLFPRVMGARNMKASRTSNPPTHRAGLMAGLLERPLVQQSDGAATRAVLCQMLDPCLVGAGFQNVYMTAGLEAIAQALTKMQGAGQLDNPVGSLMARHGQLPRNPNQGPPQERKRRGQRRPQSKPCAGEQPARLADALPEAKRFIRGMG